MSEIPNSVALLAAVAMVLSGVIALVGSLGLLRFGHVYSRMHAPTLGNTLGVFFLLLACVLLASYSAKSLLLYPLVVIVLLFVTSPITAILLMQAAIKRDGLEAQSGDGAATGRDRT